MIRTVSRFITAMGFVYWANCTPLQAEEVTIKPNNLELRANLEIAKDKTLKDGVVLMLHGTLAHNQMEIMQNLANLLKDSGYNTLSVNLSYAVDKRPSQMLDCAIEHHHQHEDAVTELQAWMTWLKEQGASKIALLGHSRGGNQVAWLAADKESALLDKLVMVAPATWDAKQAAADYETRYKQPLAPLLAAAQKQIDAGDGQLVMELPGFIYCEKAKASAAAFMSYYQDDKRKNTPELLAHIKKPMLVVMGSTDTVVADLPIQLSPIKLDNLTVATLEGADHFFLDLYTDELAEKIAEFLGW